MGLIEIQLF